MTMGIVGIKEMFLLHL